MRKLKDIYNYKDVPGDVGIEIELESSTPMPFTQLPKEWRAENDGSLRGYSVEYVMKKPMAIEKVQDSLDKLAAVILKEGGRPVYSERAGVHVHVNVLDLTVEQIVCFALTYYCLEDVLVRFCGTNREGNHFCLRIKDAEMPLHILSGMRHEMNIENFNTDQIRYASMNFLSLFRYGSLEFRAMESQPDLSKVSDWATMLCLIRNYAVSVENRESIAYDISYHSPEGFVRHVLGDRGLDLLGYDGMEEDIMSSMRNCQLALYSDPLEGEKT